MLNGVINVYKEKGFTSFDVVAKLRGILKQKKIGHTGTLDPDATGVLPVCLGIGTKLCDMLTDKSKEYKAVMLFGMDTDTEDVSGKVLSRMSVSDMEKTILETFGKDNCADNAGLEQIIADVIMSFVGPYSQIPPMYSAIKVDGKKLYELARAGITIERKPRNVEIYSIDIEKIEFPRVYFTVHCMKGTYIRSLCRDIAKKLNVCGCMEELTRTKVSIFELDKSLTLAEIEAIVKDESKDISDYIKKVDEVFDTYEKVYVKSEFVKLAHNGNEMFTNMINEAEKLQAGEFYRVYDDENVFIGVFKYSSELDKLCMIKMFYQNVLS